MIEILNPGWLSMIVDEGRYGYGGIGVPWSFALDHTAFGAANYLVGNNPGSPLIEGMGSGFALKSSRDVTCAVTGAKVKAYVNDHPVGNWGSFRLPEGSTFRIGEVTEGLRYYIGFSGTIRADRIMGSFTTNIECRFGGYKGRPFLKGDILILDDFEKTGGRSFPPELIPRITPHHNLRIVPGPETDYLTPRSIETTTGPDNRQRFTVSTTLNRTGIRLEGSPLEFRDNVTRSIISEGTIPGTVQVPGDGLPIILLGERTVGGYARVAVVIRADHDILAQMKPRDSVSFTMVGIDEAEALWRTKIKQTPFLYLNE